MQSFLGLVLRKRHLVVSLTLTLVALGLIAYQHLPLEAYPDIANMQVRVITQVPGKAAEEVERLVTIPLEKEINGIPHSQPPRSISIFGLSVVTIVFDDLVNPYVARQQVLERISHADVPEGIEPELDPNASPVGEIFRYTVEGKHWSTMDRKVIQDWLLNRKFKAVDGIVESTGFGGPTKTYQVALDPIRLQAMSLTPNQVAQAIANSNGSTGGSYIVHNDQNYMVRGMGLIKSVSDIENVVVSSTREGTPIRVKEIAEVEIGPAIRKGQVGLNEDDDVVEGILLMRRGENPAQAIENLKLAWKDIASSMPEGMYLKPLYDRTKLANETVHTISHNLAEGIILVIVLLMLFLFQVRSALICAVVIPLALLTAFVLLTIFRVPANLLSLGAIDFGIIVDGAVVMVENIVRHLDELNEASEQLKPEIMWVVLNAAREVAKPILFSTAIIVLTFLPILSFDHVEGKLFRPLAIMMNFNLLGGVLATMTIIPVLCLLVFRVKLPSRRHNPVVALIERVYERLLDFSINHRRILVMGVAGYIALSLALIPFVGCEFLPELEEGNIWLTITVLPTSVTLEKAVTIARQVRQIFRSYPEVTNVASHIGAPDDGTDPNTYSFIQVLVDLKKQDEWRPQFAHDKERLVAALDNELKEKVPGLVCNFSQYIKDNMDEAISGVKGEIAIKVFGQDMRILEDLGAKIRQVAASVKGMVDVVHDRLIGQPQLMISIDRERAARYGVDVRVILDIIETCIGGKAVTRVIDNERRFDVVLRFKKDYRDEPQEIPNILVPTPSGLRIPLGQLASITEEYGAANIYRDLNERRIAVHANIRGRDLGSSVIECQRKIASTIKLPPGYRIVWAGQFERAQEAARRLAIVVPVTLFIVFFLLYSEFGLTSLAALVMLTVPLALPAGIVALYLTRAQFSISSGVGFIALFGLAIQNGVILVSKIRQLESEGVPQQVAVLKGAMVRMRPVLIATLVALVGLIPAALSTGIGSQSQKPFAIVIVGGILPSAILTLLALPAFYGWFQHGHKTDK